jgi:PAS domain S-box-containing protein
MSEPRKSERLAEAFSSLRRVSREINTTLDLQRLLDVVLAASRRLSRAAHGAILVREGEDAAFEVRAAAGYTEDELARLRDTLEEPGTHPVVGEALRSEQVQTVSRPGAAGDRAPWFASDARAMTVVPIFYAQALTGFIVLEDPEPGRFDHQLVQFMKGLADQAAIAIGNARRYREQVERGELLRKRAEQLASVLEVAKALRSDRPLEDILEEVAYGIQETVGFDLVLISVVEGDPPVQRRMAAAGIPIPTFDRLREARQPWSLVERVMDDAFRISQSYYIPVERRPSWFDQLDTYAPARRGGGSDGESGPREPGRWHPRDLLIVPLVGSGGDVKGVISLDAPRDGLVPDRSTVEAVEVFAAQAAVAIENAQMVEMLQRRASVLALFNEISQSATAKLALDEVLDDVVEMAPRLLSCDHGSIFLRNGDDGRYAPRAVYGAGFGDASSLAFAPGQGLVGRVAETGLPLTVDEADGNRGLFLASDLDLQTAALTPMTVGDEVAGVLCVAREEPDDFAPAEVAMLSALADQVSVAVDNARLFEEVRSFSQELERRVEERTEELAAAMEELAEERDRVEALYRITSQLSASLDLDHVLSKAMSSILDAVGADRAETLLMDSQSGRLVVRAAVGGAVDLPPGGKPTGFRRGEGLAGWVIEQRAMAIVPELAEDERWIEPDRGADPFRSALAVPLVASGQALGTILLLDRAADYFREKHLRLLKTAAVQIAQAINNAELYAVIREQAERLGNMLKAQQIESTKSQAILEGVADGVMVTDAEGQVVLFNAAAERILGLPREEAMGRTTREMLGLYGSQAQDWMETVAEWMEQPGSYRSGDFLAAQLETEDRVVSVHLAPVLMGASDSLPEFLGTVSVFRDVTAEVEADRAKTEFVSMVSHELRKPMTSIKGYADLLLMGSVGPLTDGQERFLSIVRSNVDRLTTLVNDLLDISRIESGRLELSPEPIDVSETVADVAASIEARAEEKGIDLRLEVPPDLPTVRADPDRVAQILNNLVGNACQYTPSGGNVVVSAETTDGMLELTVRDTGIGISAEDRRKVFDRFFRADNPDVQSTSGTGLGLPIVKSLVGLHGGEIWVESEPGEGSAFTFTLPVVEAQELPRVSGSSKLLVVEDDLDVAKLIQFHLSDDGREVLVARRGDEALALARKERPDLITLDIMLPDVNGFELLDTLKSDPRTKEIPVVIISVVPDHQEGLRLGAAAYVGKPIDEAKLLAAVRGELTRSHGTILVADDDGDTRSLLEEVLRAHEFAVRTVARGSEVLSAARQTEPSLILLDVKLPDLDGYAVLEQLKGDPELQGIPVIVMTGSEVINDARRRKVLALGADRLLAKPFSVEALVEEIREAV